MLVICIQGNTFLLPSIIPFPALAFGILIYSFLDRYHVSIIITVYKLNFNIIIPVLTLLILEMAITTNLHPPVIFFHPTQVEILRLSLQ